MFGRIEYGQIKNYLHIVEWSHNCTTRAAPLNWLRPHVHFNLLLNWCYFLYIILLLYLFFHFFFTLRFFFYTLDFTLTLRKHLAVYIWIYQRRGLTNLTLTSSFTNVWSHDLHPRTPRKRDIYKISNLAQLGQLRVIKKQSPKTILKAMKENLIVSIFHTDKTLSNRYANQNRTKCH
jgi:hypothetical protein